jgi:preprotein translocase subunit SecA
MLKWLGNLIDSNEREVKRLQPLVDDINALEPDFEQLGDAELRAKTDEFRMRLKDGEGLDELLPEAFAAVREAAKRTIKQRHFDVQLVGGIVLHQGRIAEMKTGEGKTLVATLPLYLNALSGRGCHLVTVNDYLARRDCYWMGPIYHALGVSVAAITAMQNQDDPFPSYIYDPDFDSGDAKWKHLRSCEYAPNRPQEGRRQAYQADITYGTNNEFGFDYLRDNMVWDLSQCVQRSLNYAIVDEVDNILIDEARTPLIISGAAEEATKKYYSFARLTGQLKRDEDYSIDERTRTASLTDEGMNKMERGLKREGLLKAPQLYDPSNYFVTQYLQAALNAHALFKRDKDYVVKDGQVIIVDEFTGRLMFGRRYSEGLHQAIEAKERVKIQRESVTMATITFQNYFRMYEKLAGMTGTALTEAEEFHKIYSLDAVAIPTNRPLIRVEYPDQIYKDEKAKFAAVTREIKELNGQGRPVLIGTTSIEKSEVLSDLLKRNGVSHEVLNAKNHEKEADIIAQAGKPGAATVATNMAGRGVDIILGGTPPGYKAFEDLPEYVGKEVRTFVADGTAFLNEQNEGMGWSDAYRQRLEDKDKVIQQIQEELGPLMRRYYQEFWQGDEVAEAGTEGRLERKKIEQMEETLAQGVEDYQREYEEWAHEMEEKLKQKAEEVQGPGKDALWQKVKNLLSRKAGRESKQNTDLVLKKVVEARTQFRDWRERNRTVVELGGLHIVGTEHHEARRIDNQLRGRAGRQGDPGSSRFYASLEDEIVVRFGGDRIKGIMQWAGMDENTPIEHSFATRAITNSQVQTEGYHFNIRKHLVEYDDVVNKHREVIYAERKKILEGADLKANIMSMVRDEIQGLVAKHLSDNSYEEEGKQARLSALLEDVATIFPLPPQFSRDWLSALGAQEVEGKLTEYAVELYEQREQELGHDSMRIAERLVMLRVIDRLWMEHLTAMEHLRQGIGLRGAAQEQPLVVYKREGYAYFEALLASIQYDVVHSIFHVGVSKEAPKKKEPVSVAKKTGHKVGRNDPCPCGSGKKYKHCCGK